MFGNKPHPSCLRTARTWVPIVAFQDAEVTGEQPIQGPDEHGDGAGWLIPTAASVEEVEDLRHRARRPAPRMGEESSELLADTPERSSHHAATLPSQGITRTR